MSGFPALVIAGQELRQRKWSIVWWTLGIGAYVSINLLAYSSLSDQSAALNDALKNIPSSVRALTTDTADFISPVGFLSSKVFYLMLPLLLSFLSIGIGASLLAREEKAGTIELLLSRPIARSQLLLGKVLAGAVVVLTVSVLLTLLIVLEVATSGFGGVTVGNVAMASATVSALAFLFGALAFLLSAWGRFGRGISVGVSSVVALGGYVASSLASQVTWLEWPAKLLPYHYYHPSDLLSGKGDLWPAVVYILVALLLVGLSTVAFRRRDLAG